MARPSVTLYSTVIGSTFQLIFARGSGLKVSCHPS